MPLCHKCVHQKEIERLRGICAVCPGASEKASTAPRSVHLDASPDGTGAVVLRKGRVVPEWDMVNKPSGDSRVNLPPEAREPLFRVLREFAALTDAQAAIACRMLRGETVTQMSRDMNLTMAAVFDRWKSLCARSPVWASLANGSMGLRGGGRQPEKDATQGDLFNQRGEPRK